VHALSQQTVSTHDPLPHSSPLVHLAPRARAQVPSLPVALQTNPLGHDDAPQQTPSTQKPLAHSVAVVHPAPIAPF
jgi:hypothetical protein